MSLSIFNPVEAVNQIITLVVVCVILAFILRYRDRVLTALTGDDRLHSTPMDCVHFLFFRCCGACNDGQWTRVLTRGANLWTRFGQLLGVIPYTIELRNIIVGDLPWDKRADFYLQVECSANPPIVTALAEEKLPKVVHFPEVITLRVRWTLLDPAVKITVRELNVLGHTNVCTAHVSAMQMVDWARSPRDCVKRIEMKPMVHDIERETPAWILLEMTHPHDDRDLDNFWAGTTTVRTSTRDAAGHYQDESISNFKHQYALLDPSGHVMQEPLEEDLQGIQCCETATRRCFRFLLCWGVIILITPSLLEFWGLDCFRRYKWITMARLMYPNQKAFSTEALKAINQQCHYQTDGTGATVGTPCRPSPAQILATCAGPNTTDYPPEQPAVGAFPRFFGVVTGREDYFSCPAQVCEGILSHKNDSLLVIGSGWVLLFLLLFSIKCIGYRVTENQRRRMTQNQVEATNEAIKLTRKNRGLETA